MKMAINFCQLLEIFGLQIGNGTIVIFASVTGVLAGEGFEGGGNIWLAGAGPASGTTFARGGFGLTSEFELEADSGGFVVFDVEDR